MNRIIDDENVLIEEIKCPQLNSVEFASDLQSAFDNINLNFATLANHDFIKGDPGKSVYIKSVNIYESEELTEIGKSLESFLKDILGNQSEEITAGNTTLNFWDNFTKENAGSLQLIYNSSNDSINEEDELFSSLQYVFLDGRFWNENIGKIDLSTYDGIDDKSCIIVYDGEKFESLNNAFPTLYYEHSVGLCWKINGKKTGIPVQGIAGKDGKNAIMHIVKVDSIDDNTSESKVTSIFESKSGYIEVGNSDININDYNESSALIIDKNSKLYFGLLFTENDTLYAKVDPNVSLNDITTSEDINSAFKNIKLINNIKNPSHLKGLFIPINDGSEQSVHLISASSVTNVEGQKTTSETSDVIFTPIKDIDNLNVSEENPLNIEKYLYVKVNKDFSILEAKNNDNTLSELLKPYNYCIKYKLKCIVTDEEDNNLKPETIYSDSIFGVVNFNGEEITLTKDNVTYYNGDNYKNTLPKIDEQNPLYVWEQCTEGANFDIDELKKHETFNIPIQFKTICTRTFTPGISSQIFWFNPLEIVESSNNTYKIKGWRNNWNSQDTESLFKILKFVPIFIDKDFHVSKDTAINFNYNVNITGCNEDSDEQRNKRNLTVHGDINCDNINVYKITSTGGIDNVITPNTIYGDDGINIGKGENGYNFTVNNTGDINASNLDLSGDINVSNLTVKSEGESNSLVSFENIKDFKISGNENNYNDESYIDKDKISEDISSLSKQNISKLSSVYTNNGNIVVTDQSTSSPDLYYYGMPKPYPNDDIEISNLHFRTDKIDFDNAKRFTFNRIKNKDYTKIINTKLITNSSASINDYNEKLISSKSDNASFAPSINGVFKYNTEKYNTGSDDDINKYILEKFEITADENDKLINSENINISFNKNYICHINLRGLIDNGSFPYLVNSSSMQLMLYYEDLDKNLKLISKQTYDFSSTETAWNNNVYDKNGYIVNTTRESDRIKSYFFKPNDFTIDTTSEAFNAIKEINNNGESVKLYVIPEFSINASSSKPASDESIPATVKYIEVYFPVSNSDLTQISPSNKLILTDEIIKINNVEIENTTNAELTYGCVSEAPGNKINSTTICKDGVLFRASDYMFGLGYSKDSFLTHDSGYLYNENKTWENSEYKTDEPILFYYKSVDVHDMQTTGEEIAKKINVITLDDLFTAIQLLKTKFPTEWSQSKDNNIFA